MLHPANLYYTPARRKPVGLHSGGKGGGVLPRQGTEGGPGVNRQPVDLGFVLKQFPRLEFGMHTFEHRLRLQKFVYLLQAFDVYLGYDYSWYLRGPYCSNLAASGFALAEFYGDIPGGSRMSFSSSAVHGRFEKFVEFIAGREADTDFLEMAASFHFLEKGGGLSRDEIFEKVRNKRKPSFTESRCREVRSNLEEWDLVGRPGAGPPSPAPGAGRGYGEEPCWGWFAQAAEVPDAMDFRPFDKGLYHMLLDSKEGGEKIVLVGKDVFRPDQRRPPIDEITVEDKRLLVDLLQRG